MRGDEPGQSSSSLPSPAPEPVESGSLLVAMPLLRDPNFRRTVVYVVDHDATGTLGLVLTQPSSVDVLDLLPQWWELAASPRRVHVGGPCERNAALALAVGVPGVEAPGLRRVAGSVNAAVYLVDLDAEPESIARHCTGLRVFAGYSGWGPGQLDDEITEGAWIVLPGLPGDLVVDDGVDLWRRVLARQGGRLAFLSTCPDDPTLN